MNKRINLYTLSARWPTEPTKPFFISASKAENLDKAKLWADQLCESYVGALIYIKRQNFKNCGIWRAGAFSDPVGIMYMSTYWPIDLWKKWHKGTFEEWKDQSLTIYFRHNARIGMSEITHVELSK